MGAARGGSWRARRGVSAAAGGGGRQRSRELTMVKPESPRCGRCCKSSGLELGLLEEGGGRAGQRVRRARAPAGRRRGWPQRLGPSPQELGPALAILGDQDRSTSRPAAPATPGLLAGPAKGSGPEGAVRALEQALGPPTASRARGSSRG